MTEFQILLALAVSVAAIATLVVWIWMRRRTGDRELSASQDRIDTVIGWPPTPVRLLDGTERAALATLVRALPEFMILAQVPLSRFVNVPKRNSYADWLRRIGYQCVDFVVCDKVAQVIAVVELQGPQPTERSRKRMIRLARVLKAAKLPLQIWREDKLPSVDAARGSILGRLAPATARASSAEAEAVAAPAAAALPQPSQPSPFDDTHRDSTQDERIEMLEPRPSTWFDDLDSDIAPLGKR